MQMVNVRLSNSASVTGTYDTSLLTLTSNEVITEIVSGITITKEADKQKWLDGNLTYTITVENNSNDDFQSPKLVDVLDPNLIKLVDGSVQLNGVDTAYNYDDVTGTLTIDLKTITVGETSVITFRVQQK